LSVIPVGAASDVFADPVCVALSIQTRRAWGRPLKTSKERLAMKEDQQSEPPSWLRPPLFMEDKRGMRGGLFVNREAALRYVRSENGFKPQAVVMVSGGFELEMSSNAGASSRAENASDFANRRRIA